MWKTRKQMMRKRCLAALLAATVVANGSLAFAQQETSSHVREKVILDTDIGDDIDDAFALALVLSSPEIELLGVSTAWGNTQLRARIVDRLFCETGKEEIPILAGIETTSKVPMDHARWAEAMPPRDKPFGSALDFILEEIRRYPNQITLIAVAPLTNVGALIERDPETFRKLKRVVIMGGSIYRGYNDLGYIPDRGAQAEYNIASDIPAARRLFASGVPLFVMPLDSTQLKLDEVKRELLFRQSTPLTDALTLLYHQWGQQTPTLYDPVAVAFAIAPQICPTQPLHIEIDEQGFTRPVAGPPNAQVCLNSKSEEFFHLYLARILTQKLGGHCSR
jgi:inosine-uridine nucleoside N-ribohydrolase